jgi:hypothetical protein
MMATQKYQIRMLVTIEEGDVPFFQLENWVTGLKLEMDKHDEYLAELDDYGIAMTKLKSLPTGDWEKD